MKIRLGYACSTLALPKVTSSSNVTFSYYSKIISEEKKFNHLKKITLSNIDDLYRIIEYNNENQIHFYRMTSKLIPLATHPQVNWDFLRYFNTDLKRVGTLIKNTNLRMDSHPDHFNVLNSTNEDVIANTKKNLQHDVDIFNAMDLNEQYSKMVIHLGSCQGGKKNSKERFIKQFRTLDNSLKNRLIIENDDKIFNIEDVLEVCNSLKIPAVLDIHHHKCNPSENDINSLIENVISTWKNEELPPKVHLSSSRKGEIDRRHADYIKSIDFINLVELFKPFNTDFDIMLETKKKDIALFELINDIKKIKKNWKWIDKTTLEL